MRSHAVSSQYELLKKSLEQTVNRSSKSLILFTGTFLHDSPCLVRRFYHQYSNSSLMRVVQADGGYINPRQRLDQPEL